MAAFPLVATMFGLLKLSSMIEPCLSAEIESWRLIWGAPGSLTRRLRAPFQIPIAGSKRYAASRDRPCSCAAR